MTKLGMSVGILATVFCLAAGGQTINVMALDQAGAQTVLQAAKESAQQRNAINNNCLACHSANHVLNQLRCPGRPGKEVVSKMIRAYKAPVSPDDAKSIVDYLVRTKGAS
jgi:hypothetical protein